MKKFSTLLILLLSFGWISVMAQCNPQFTWAQTLGYGFLNVTVTNTSVIPPPSITSMTHFTVNFGDNTNTQNLYGPINHNYSSPGTYTVKVVMRVYDSLTATTVCKDSVMQQVTVAYPACATVKNSYNLGNGLFAFAAHNLANTPGITYNWYFGDGNVATGDSVTHTYLNAGNYNVILVVNSTSCTDSLYQNIVYHTLNCDSLAASFTTNSSGLTAYFYNASTWMNVFYSMGISNQATWLFGDGNSANTVGAVHTYANPGTYTVTLINSWVDTANQIVHCTDTTTGSITITAPITPNVISGNVYWDSLGATAPTQIKVWLIKHDSIANTLTAVDSLLTYTHNYAFSNHAAGHYLVKASAMNQTPSVSGWVPTYHYTSLYWHTATTIVHNAGTTAGKNIFLQAGTVSAGPGFVGGNISLGAGRGTNTGAPDVLVFIRNSSNEVIASTYTDQQGDFSFQELPIGTYNVYPEEMNYITTPSASINITSNAASISNVDFEKAGNEIRPLTATSLSNVLNNDELSVYPNPTRGMITVDNKAGKYQKINIVNLVGQNLQQQSLTTGKNTLDITSLPSGIYYLTMSGAKDVGSIKMIKK